jgi:Domain of unknown function (DUF4178)
MPVYAPSTSRPTAQTLRCPSCGAPLELRNVGRTQSVTCAYCDSVIDTRDANLAVLFRWEQQARIKPLIPLGTRGTLRGVTLECLAFVCRQVEVDGRVYPWCEYLLYNPYKGYRWLVDSDGHWTLVAECIGLPTSTTGPVVTNLPVTSIYYGGMSFKHFQSSLAKTTYCLGEAYWQIKQNDTVVSTDYVCPPYMLSAEQDGDETIWSIGEYITEAELAAAFAMERTVGEPLGVAPCQPNPLQPASVLWVRYLLYVMAAFVLTIGFAMLGQNQLVTTVQGQYFDNQKERTQVSDYFTLTGRACNVVLRVRASGLDGRWAYFKLALINQDTSEAIDFGTDLSYYHGVDDGEAWSEGSKDNEVVVPHVPPGHYFVRVEPESGSGGSPDPLTDAPQPGHHVFDYTVDVRRDVTRFGWLWWVVLGLLPWPIIQAWRYSSFETRRWSESDHPPASTSDGGED